MVLVINSGGSASVWVWLGPVLLFVASMITLYFTNHSADARAAKERQHQRQRDFRLWQRDALLQISNDVADYALAAHEKYNDILTHGNSPEDESFEEIDNNVRKIHTCLLRLRLIGAGEPATKCDELHAALRTEDGLGQAISDARQNHLDTITEALQGRQREHAARAEELSATIKTEMLRIYNKRDAFVDAAKSELSRSDELDNSPKREAE